MNDTFSSPTIGRRPPTWVSAVALIAADGRILMQRRPQASDHGSLWEFPGGKLEPGETPEAAAVRELAEELSIAIAHSDLKPAGFVTNAGTLAGSGAGLGRALIIMLFACRRWEGEPIPCAADEIAWHRHDELATLAMPPLDYPLAEGLCNFLHINAF